MTKNLLHKQSELPAYASKQDVLKFATLRYLCFDDMFMKYHYRYLLKTKTEKKLIRNFISVFSWPFMCVHFAIQKGQSGIVEGKSDPF